MNPVAGRRANQPTRRLGKDCADIVTNTRRKLWTAWGWPRRWAFAAAFAALAVLVAVPGRAEPEAHYWVDVHTGLAIGGYDPLSYFVDGAARPGRREHEAEWAGVTWRFASAANRAAFLDNPHVYAPRYGGYSPSGVAEGVAVRGNPLIWSIHGQRLYLFYSPQHKLVWDRDQARIATAAEARWPAVSRTLAN